MIVNYAEFIISNTSDKIAIIEDDKTLTYQQLAIHVRRSAYKLKSLGIVPGDRIIISLPDSIEWIVAFLSCIKIGAVPMQASPLILHHKIVEIINFVKAHAIVSKEIFNGIIRIDPNELLSSGPELDDYYNFSPDEIALAVTTSGSTSDSKFACHRHQNLINFSHKTNITNQLPSQ